MIFRLLSMLVKTGSVVLMLVLIAGWMQSLHPAFDSFSHFRLHFAGLLTIGTVLFLLARNRSWALACLGVTAISIALTWPYLPLVPVSSATADSSAATVRIVQMNLRFNNPNPELAVAAIREGEPDIILLQEVTLMTQSVMRDMGTTHPHQLSCQMRGVGSVAILSRYKFSNQTNNRCARFFGYASAKIQIGEQELSLASFHSRWPWPAGQEQQIENLRREFSSLKPPLVVAGDFNSAPWSEAVRKVARMSGTSPVPGVVLTWAPRFVEFKTTIGALLPLDQILLSPDIQPVSRRVLKDGGSDHFAVLTVIRSPKP